MKKLIVIAAAMFLFFNSLEGASAFSRPEDHVIVKGEALAGMINSPVDMVRVYALKNGKLIPIPFQIDKVDIDGKFIFNDKEAKEKAAKRKEIYEDALDDRDEYTAEQLKTLKREASWIENMNVFDGQDELVFMAWDLGKKASKGMLPKAKAIEEIAITNPVDRDTAYAYAALFEGNPPALSAQSYLSYIPENDQLETQCFKILFDKENSFKFRGCNMRNGDGKWGPNCIDQMKMRFKIDIKYFLTINFDENNSNGKLIAYKAGPVRVIRQLKFWIELFYLKVTPVVIMDFVFYTNGFIAPAQMDIPFSPQSTMNEPSRFIIGQDFNNNFAGYKVYTAKNNSPVLFDGKMTEEEKNLKLENQNWYVVYKDNGLGFFSQMVFDKRLTVTGDIFYLDDKDVDMEPEDEPGQHFVAFSAGLKQFPKGTYNMYIYTYIDKNWVKGKEKRYLNFIDHPLKVKASRIK